MDSDENEPTSSTHVPDDSNSSTQQTTFNAKNQINEASIESSILNMNDRDAYSVTNSNNNKTSGAGTVIHKANITNMVSGGSGNSDTSQQINAATDRQPPQQVGESFRIKIWNFAIHASGKTALIVGTGATLILYTAVTQSLSIIHDLCQAYASNSNQAVTSITPGCINVQVVTKGDEAMKILLQDYFYGKITREVKKILEEALKKEDAECEIQSVTLTEVGVVMADQDVFDDIKRETEQTLSQLSTSQDLFKNEITLSRTSTMLHDKYQVMTEKISPTATEEDVINQIRNLELRVQTQTTKASSSESVSKSQTNLPLNPEADAKKTGDEVLRPFHSMRLSSSSSDSYSHEDEPFVSKRLWMKDAGSLGFPGSPDSSDSPSSPSFPESLFSAHPFPGLFHPIPTIPNISIPNISIPNISIPNISIPNIVQAMAVALPERDIESQRTSKKHPADLPLNPEVDAEKTGGEVLRLFHSGRLSSSSSDSSSDEDESFVSKRLRMKSSDAEPITKSVGSDSSALKETQSRKPDSSATEYRYNMNHHERGCFLIFIFTGSYYSIRRYRKMLNSDAKRLKNMAEELGFEHVRIIENETYANIKKLLTELSQADHSNYDCFACAILGCCDDAGMHFLRVRDGFMLKKDFMKPFSAENCRSLAMKPKLFFINNFTKQPFTSRLWETDIPADSLEVNSTEGYFCTTFLQCLCATIEGYGDTMEIMQAVAQANRMIARENSSDKLPFNQMQIPLITSRLTREVYFPRKKMMTLVSRMDVHEHSVDIPALQEQEQIPSRENPLIEKLEHVEKFPQQTSDVTLHDEPTTSESNE